MKGIQTVQQTNHTDTKRSLVLHNKKLDVFTIHTSARTPGKNESHISKDQRTKCHGPCVGTTS